MRVALVCYKIEQGQGSEAGSGYGFARELAHHVQDLTVVTRCDNAALLKEDPAFANVRLIGLDVPRRWSFYKKGSRGVVPYYYTWQRLAGRRLQQLHEVKAFDVVHQYNFHTDWAPHFIACEGARVVWGPICHQPRLPRYFTQGLSPKFGVSETVKSASKSLFWYGDPLLKRAIARSDVILYANPDIAPPFRKAMEKVELQTFGGSRAVDKSAAAATGRRSTLKLLHVGRQVPIKGAHLAVQALSAYRELAGPRVELEVVGEGPLAPHLLHLSQALELEDELQLTPWLNAERLAERYAQADALLYPSLGNQDTVVAEALAAGLPVIGIQGSGTAFMAREAGLMAEGASLPQLLQGLAECIYTLASEASLQPTGLERRRTVSRERAVDLSWPGTARGVLSRYRA